MMHEYSIACEIWDSVKKAAEQHGGGRVVSVALEIGALNLVEEDQLTFWLETLAERDGSPHMKVKITTSPPQLRCRNCGVESVPANVGANLSGRPPGQREPAERLPYGPILPACERCGSRDLEVISGREIRVVSAKIELRKSAPPPERREGA
jgi:hydrogenase nickel incorporation protein HypA/HybF